MPFSLLVAWRYITANSLQTLLLVLGVSLSVVVFVFITALINGLSIFLTQETTSKIAHIELEPANKIARVLTNDNRFVAQPVSTLQRKQIRNWQQVIEIAGSTPGVSVISPIVDGNAFLVRGEATQPIAIQGVEPSKVDAITNISSYIIKGTAELTTGGLIIGADLADELGLFVGTPVLLKSERGAERLLSITGIFRVGLSSLDQRVGFLSINVARPLFDLPDGITSLGLKLDDPADAPAIAKVLQNSTQLKSTPWQEKNKSLQNATDAQGRTGNFIQGFTLLAIIISISSALLLSTYRRRAEIGIMRATGISRQFVATVFIFQGIFIGALGAFLGAAAGYQLCVKLASITKADGSSMLPIAPSEGGYMLVIILTIVGAALAAVLPARAASAVDPVEAIQQ
ncbi:ABC transporter permease [uncultured Psychrosphaera sp.]|uniref:ABC transporter permease n=1 Tax=uncultured Psychrosphaera sp. TaxID=1403522 RepID=UPI00261CC4B8|nr:ABC transporter permease [uncultured Psychrosphaera sp.]